MSDAEWKSLSPWRRQYLFDPIRWNAKSQKWRETHRTESRSAAKKWKSRNIEKAKRIYKNWVIRNRVKRRLTSKISRHKHRAKTRLCDCSVKIAILNRERFCHWCCTRLNEANRQIDHMIPLSRGGEHKPDNLVAACSFCNNSKNDRLVEEWTWELAA